MLGNKEYNGSQHAEYPTVIHILHSANSMWTWASITGLRHVIIETQSGLLHAWWHYCHCLSMYYILPYPSTSHAITAHPGETCAPGVGSWLTLYTNVPRKIVAENPASGSKGGRRKVKSLHAWSLIYTFSNLLLHCSSRCTHPITLHSKRANNNLNPVEPTAQ